MDLRVKDIFDEYCKPWIPEEFFGKITMDRVMPSYRSTVEATINDLTSPHPRGLILSGSFGIGKTSILYLILLAHLTNCRELVTRGLTDPELDVLTQEQFNVLMSHENGAAFYTHLRLEGILRNHFKDHNPRYDEWLPGPLCRRFLFIDDLGLGYDTTWNIALQNELFDYRWSHRLPTFATTMKTDKELRAWSGWDRIIDRLCDPSYSRMAAAEGDSMRRAGDNKRGRKP